MVDTTKYTREQLESALGFAVREGIKYKTELDAIREIRSDAELELGRIFDHFKERSANGVIRRFDNAIKARNRVQDLVYQALKESSPNRKNRNKPSKEGCGKTIFSNACSDCDA